MAVQVKGGMFCPQCNSPVAAQKRTHRLRNTAAVVAAPVTAGASLAAAASGQWHCPRCGGPVVKLAKPAASGDPMEGVAALILFAFIGAIILLFNYLGG